jgi:hypothetical protein
MVTSLVPSVPQIRQALLDLLTGRRSREDVAGWAGQWVNASIPTVDDPVVWKALGELAGADLRVSPHEYLHSDADFHLWLDNLEVGSAADPDGRS